MIAFLLALLLWMVGRTPAPAVPAPAPHGVTVSPAAPAPAAGRPQRPVGAPRAVLPQDVPGQRSAAPSTVPAAPTTSWFPQTWTPVLTPPPAPTDLPPVGDGPELQGPYMCTDPVDCPHGG